MSFVCWYPAEICIKIIFESKTHSIENVPPSLIFVSQIFFPLRSEFPSIQIPPQRTDLCIILYIEIFPEVLMINVLDKLIFYMFYFILF